MYRSGHKLLLWVVRVRVVMALVVRVMVVRVLGVRVMVDWSQLKSLFHTNHPQHFH